MIADTVDPPPHARMGPEVDDARWRLRLDDDARVASFGVCHRTLCVGEDRAGCRVVEFHGERVTVIQCHVRAVIPPHHERISR